MNMPRRIMLGAAVGFTSVLISYPDARCFAVEPQIYAKPCGEPWGLESVDIKEAWVRLDFRDTLASGPQRRSIYVLHESSQRRSVRLLLLMHVASNRAVYLDGKWLPTTSTGIEEIAPDEWHRTLATPRLNGKSSLPYYEWHGLPTICDFTLTQGDHRLEIRHSIASGYYPEESYTGVGDLQFVYNLSAVRARKHAYPIHMEVLFPRAATVASSPSMRREGLALRGTLAPPLPTAVALTWRLPEPFILFPALGLRVELIITILALTVAIFWLIWKQSAAPESDVRA